LIGTGGGATEDLTWSYRALQGLLKYVTVNETRKVNIVMTKEAEKCCQKHSTSALGSTVVLVIRNSQK